MNVYILHAAVFDSANRIVSQLSLGLVWLITMITWIA